jgi:hypothetical protein
LRAHVMKTRHRKGYLSSGPRERKRNSRIFAPSSLPSRSFRLTAIHALGQSRTIRHESGSRLE